MNLAVLLGAGASYGSGNVVPQRPPLGSELFEKLKRAYPDSWGSLLTDEENRAFQEDFEQGMDRIWGAPGGQAQPLLIDMSLYFATFRATGANCYTALLDLVTTSPEIRFLFCTLNYDLLFEQAVLESRRSLHSLGQVLGTGPGVPLLKPHGSCNYIHRVTRNMHNVTMGGGMVHYVYSETPRLDDIEIVSADELRRVYGETGLSVPPVISLYAPTKHNPVGFQEIQLVRASWAQAADQADVILAIGTRPVEHDTHVWDPILQSHAEVWFVGGQDSDYGRRSWELGDRMHYLGQRFGESLRELERRLAVQPTSKGLWTPQDQR